MNLKAVQVLKICTIAVKGHQGFQWINMIQKHMVNAIIMQTFSVGCEMLDGEIYTIYK